jgi:tetratricopeptide (TPR) repeat protein
LAEAYVNRGTLLLGRAKTQKEIENILEEATKAIGLKPRLEPAYNLRGSAFLRLGLLKQAEADFTKAIQLNSNYAFAVFNRGITRVTQRNFAGAVEDLRKASGLAPMLKDRATPWIEKAETALKSKGK